MSNLTRDDRSHSRERYLSTVTVFARTISERYAQHRPAESLLYDLVVVKDEKMGFEYLRHAAVQGMVLNRLTFVSEGDVRFVNSRLRHYDWVSSDPDMTSTSTITRAVGAMFSRDRKIVRWFWSKTVFQSSSDRNDLNPSTYSLSRWQNEITFWCEREQWTARWLNNFTTIIRMSGHISHIRKDHDRFDLARS
jgi:hypothetical protein